MKIQRATILRNIIHPILALGLTMSALALDDRLDEPNPQEEPKPKPPHMPDLVPLSLKLKQDYSNAGGHMYSATISVANFGTADCYQYFVCHFGYRVLATNDPAAIVQKALKPVKKGRQPAMTTLAQAREIIERVDREPAHPVTKLAMRLLALTVVRPGTLIGTTWTEFERLDADRPTWTVPAARMKLKLMYKDDERRDHLVPLARQAVETIDAVRKLTGRCPFVFPNARHAHKPASENALGYLLNRAGYHHRHVPHGWRSTFSTVMNERFRDDRQIIDLMLAHVPENKVEGAYNRAEHIGRRRELAQEWADLLMKGQMPVEELLTLPRR